MYEYIPIEHTRVSYIYNLRIWDNIDTVVMVDEKTHNENSCSLLLFREYTL